jgi:hypothetical protein
MAPLFDPIPASTLLGGRQRRAATAGSGPAPPYPSAHLCRKYGGVIEPVNQRRKAAALPQAPEVNGFSSYPPEEVNFLVKDLSGVLVEVSRTEYEDEISQGPPLRGDAPRGGVSTDGRGTQPFRAGAE